MKIGLILGTLLNTGRDGNQLTGKKKCCVSTFFGKKSMLISEKYKFIFIHIYKNAGTSISRSLIKYSVNPVHFFAHRVLKRVGIKKFNPVPYPKHITAPRLIEKMGYENFKSYYSFAVVRNPWDWNVSLYKYMVKDPNHHYHEWAKSFKDFDDYIRTRCIEDQSPQRNYLFSKDGEQLVDFIARFENLDEDFQTICSEIGIITTLPHLNVSNTRDYRDFYTEETRDLVYRSFRKDIDLFNYEF